jgi:hypothetical protein
MVVPNNRLSPEACPVTAIRRCVGYRPTSIGRRWREAGGGLTVVLSLYACNRGKVNIAFQMPFYPKLDDQTHAELAHDNNAPV